MRGDAAAFTVSHLGSGRHGSEVCSWHGELVFNGEHDIK